MSKYLCLAAALALSTVAAFSQSSKETAAISTVSVQSCAISASNCPGTWTDLVPTLNVQTSNSQSLFVNVSTVVGLYTSTQVHGNNTGATSTAVASAGVHVRVLLDGVVYAFPDVMGSGIDFDNRVQTLTANLGNIFTSDCAANPTTCTLTAEQITLILQTSSAHDFNFVLLNVGSGSHTIDVQVMADTNSSASTGGVAIAGAAYGPASVTVDTVRLVHGFSF